MESQPVLPSTFVIERSYPVSRERVFAALSQEDQKRRWYAGGDSAVFEMDFRVGGRSVSRSRMGADTPFEGVELANEEHFHDIVPDRRIVSAARPWVSRRVTAWVSTSLRWCGTPHPSVRGCRPLTCWSPVPNLNTVQLITVQVEDTTP